MGSRAGIAGLPCRREGQDVRVPPSCWPPLGISAPESHLRFCSALSDQGPGASLWRAGHLQEEPWQILAAGRLGYARATSCLLLLREERQVKQTLPPGRQVLGQKRQNSLPPRRRGEAACSQGKGSPSSCPGGRSQAGPSPLPCQDRLRKGAPAARVGASLPHSVLSSTLLYLPLCPAHPSPGGGQGPLNQTEVSPSAAHRFVCI